MKDPIAINVWTRSILGLSLIMGACGVISIGVASGFPSPVPGQNTVPDPVETATLAQTEKPLARFATPVAQERTRPDVF